MDILRFSRLGIGFKITAVLAAALLSACAGAPTVTPEARSELAPTGKLRVALLVTNRAYVIKDGAPDAMQGIGVDLGRELAKQLNVAFEPVRYKHVAALLDGARRGEWDVSPIGYSVDRTSIMDFTPLYTVGRNIYVVPAGSSMRTVADVDNSKHRIAVVGRSVQEAYLKANLKHATVIPTRTFSEAQARIRADKADAYFASELTLRQWIVKRPDFRMLEGRVLAGGNALAIATGRPAGTAYATRFIEHAKASGLIQQAIERSGLTDIIVAPAGAAR